MPPLKTCRQCGKEMPKGSLFRHEHVMCEKRPGAATVPDSPAPTAQAAQGATKAPRPARPTRKPVTRTATGLGTVKTSALATEEPKQMAVAHCEEAACPYRGLSDPIQQFRVQELVRGGLGIEHAARFVREHCAG